MGTHRPTPTFKDNMKAAILAIVLFGLASAASAQEYDLEESEARFLYFNSSSTATSLTLLGAVILLGVIGYLGYVGGLLGTSSSYNRNDYYDPAAYQGEYAGYAQQAQYRSDEKQGINAEQIMEGISMLYDLYQSTQN